MRQILTAPIATARDAHFEYDRRTLLVEKQSTNIIINSDDLVTGAGWVSGTPPVMVANSNRFGVVPLHKLLVATTPLADRAQIIALTGNGTKAVRQLLRFAGEVGTTVVRLFDNTAVASRFSANVVWAADATAVCNVTVGTLYRFESLGAGVYLLEGAAVGCVAANTNLIFPLQAASTAGAEIGGVQVEDGAFPSSYIATGAAIVTRAADRVELPFAALPQAMTLYLRFIERGGTQLGQYLAMVGGPADNFFAVLAGGGVYNLLLTIGGVNRTVTPGAAPQFGDVVELRCILNANGSIQFGQSINGAAETLTAASAALALPGAWGSALLALCGVPGAGAASAAAFERIVAQAGIQTLATMQALAQ